MAIQGSHKSTRAATHSIAAKRRAAAQPANSRPTVAPAEPAPHNEAAITQLFWRTRPDGSRFLNAETDAAILRQTNSQARDVADRPIADLILDCLAPQAHQNDFDPPEERQTFDNAFLAAVGLELRATRLALQNGDFTPEQVLSLVTSLEKRVQAGTELLRRLHHARWHSLAAARRAQRSQ